MSTIPIRPALSGAGGLGPSGELAAGAFEPAEQDRKARRERRTKAPTPGGLVLSDALLVRLAQQGSRRAFDRLWLRHAPTAHAVLLSMLPPAEADDLLQDAAMASWQAKKRLQQADRFGAWLCSIARNLGRDRLAARRAERSVDLEQAQNVAVRDRGPAMAEAEEVLSVLRTLPDCYSETLAMRLVLGMTGPEIARRTGRTNGSVRVNLHRGMKLLRQALDADSYE